MTQSQYSLWLSVYNAGILAGKPAAQALADADKAAKSLPAEA